EIGHLGREVRAVDRRGHELARLLRHREHEPAFDPPLLDARKIRPQQLLAVLGAEAERLPRALADQLPELTQVAAVERRSDELSARPEDASALADRLLDVGSV